MLIYQIYIRTFNGALKKESSSLHGVIEKVSYLKKLGVDAIWLTPFYPSPLIDNGYDVADYRSIDKSLGTMTEFKDLLNSCHKEGIKVFIDVVFNHSSDQHEWFQKSILKIEPYSDYYIWSNQPLNNWQSEFGGSAWSYHEQRGQYFLHRFAKEQPDLNFLNSKVVNECIDILNYWVELGVDGFRFDVINFLITDSKKLTTDNQEGKPKNSLNHEPTLQVVKEIRKAVQERSAKEITFIGEVGSEEIAVLESYIGVDLMDYVFNFNIGSIKEHDLEKLVIELVKTYEKIANPTLFFSSHDMARFYNRLAKYDKKRYKAYLATIFLLKGIKILYQGDEFGELDADIKQVSDLRDVQAVNEYEIIFEQTQDSQKAFEQAKSKSRDYSRKLMTWKIDDEVWNFVKELQQVVAKYFDYYNGVIENIEVENQILKFELHSKNGILKIKINFDTGEYIIKE